MGGALTILAALLYAAALFAVAFAVERSNRRLPRTAYTLSLAVYFTSWTFFGAVGTAALGVALFDEPATLGRVASIGLIVAGIVGLKLTTPT